MTEPNPRQRELIENTEGTYLVDAGPGTGKTFTLTRRYAAIVDREGVEPGDVCLLTFTRNAATEMRDRVVDVSDYGAKALRDAPIGTFHSLCNDVLREHGFDAPSHLGIDEAITGATRVLEDETVEREYVREFVGRFADDHPEHRDVLRALSDPTELRDLFTNLAAKGIFPTAEGWYRDCEELLYGDREAFDEVFAELNRPRNGGSKQSQLRGDLGGYGRDACYLPDAPPRAEIRGERGSKAVPDDVADRVFDEDREALVSFVHDAYLEYLEFALSRNYLTFAFLQLFAFVHLCENEGLRDRLAYDYVMIDEFQDTSEIQFKLALLLAGTENLCAVGDWKQSIYSFQYADVENITAFRARLDRYVDDLNADRTRIDAAFDDVAEIELRRNYRSTASIVERSEDALVVPGSTTEEVDAEAILDDVVSLEAVTDRDHSRIEAIQHEDEHAALLSKIEAIVGNEAYAVRDEDVRGDVEADVDTDDSDDSDEPLRPPTYGDIAVLTRTRDFGRELLSAAEAAGMPVAYEGGVELFRTDPAKLVLAWLRILEGGPDADRGWAVVLERAGYAAGEIEHVLETGAYPSSLREFRAELAALDTDSGVANRVCERYGYDGPTAELLCTTVGSVTESAATTRGDLIRHVERGVESGTTHEVTAAAGSNAVRVQTIHAAKGLEYPIVICANVNGGTFPSTGGGGGAVIRYDEPAGLRQRTLYGEAHGEPHLYDNWRWDVLGCCRPTEYDEERRLLYVATTRARDHVLFTAGEEPSSFLEEFPVEIEAAAPRDVDPGAAETVQSRFDVAIPEPEGPVGYSPHSLMDDAVFERVESGRGPEFGSRVHEFAERYALDEPVEPPTDEVERRHRDRIRSFLDSLEGELRVEEQVHLPLTVDGERVTVSGIADLVHVTDDAVEVVDYKTDVERHARAEYRTQLSVYYHVVDAAYPDREVTAQLFYTAADDPEPVDVLDRSELVDLVRERLDDAGTVDA